MKWNSNTSPNGHIAFTHKTNTFYSFGYDLLSWLAPAGLGGLTGWLTLAVCPPSGPFGDLGTFI